MTDYNKLHNAQSIAWEWGQGVTDAETAIRKLHKLFPIDAEIAEKVEPVAWMWLEGTELMNGTDVEQFERVEFSREKPDEDAYGLTPLYTAPLSGVRAGMLRAAGICKEWEAKLSQGAGYAIRTAKEAITSAADQVNEDSYSAGVDRDRAAGIYRDTVPVDQVNESQPETVAVPEGCTPEDARVLRQANHELAETEQRLRTALRFYANGYHFDVSGDPDAWDNVSGEPANFFCDEAGTATMEDGTIAKMALLGESIDWKNEAGEDETPPEIEGEYPEIDAMLLAAQEAK